MSGFNESSNSDTPASACFNQAVAAFGRGELELSEELCRKAAELYEQAGEDEPGSTDDFPRFADHFKDTAGKSSVLRRKKGDSHRIRDVCER